MLLADLYAYWYLGLGIGALVVVIVAALLLWILALVRSIAANATVALHAVEQIRTNTQPIWALQDTNAVGVQLLEGAQSIRAHAETIADVLESGQASLIPTA
jgi:sensor c-di-GMP phosphodiesterase-like protein